MWDNVIIFGVEAFVFMLLYASFKLNRDAAKYLGVIMFFSALAFQQWAFVLMIDIATDAGKTEIAASLGKLYGAYPTLLYVCLIYYVFLIALEILELYTGENITEQLKHKFRRTRKPWENPP